MRLCERLSISVMGGPPSPLRVAPSASGRRSSRSRWAAGCLCGMIVTVTTMITISTQRRWSVCWKPNRRNALRRLLTARVMRSLVSRQNTFSISPSTCRSATHSNRRRRRLTHWNRRQARQTEAGLLTPVGQLILRRLTKARLTERWRRGRGRRQTSASGSKALAMASSQSEAAGICGGGLRRERVVSVQQTVDLARFIMPHTACIACMHRIMWLDCCDCRLRGVRRRGVESGRVDGRRTLAHLDARDGRMRAVCEGGQLLRRTRRFTQKHCEAQPRVPRVTASIYSDPKTLL
mmetsp:Transcript_68765/g.153446  ORF Transcript_68765/g.153446 Transcript_68765/m.153446 type:complete len:293 (+) Transcript_68765:1497-2375(+)